MAPIHSLAMAFSLCLCLFHYCLIKRLNSGSMCFKHYFLSTWNVYWDVLNGRLPWALALLFPSR